MAISSDQRKAFNEALKLVELAGKDLKSFYASSLKEINKLIGDFKLKLDKGQLNSVEAMKYERLTKLYKSIDDELKILFKNQAAVIKAGYVQEYTEAYYKIGFAIERDVNLNLLSGQTYDYSLNFTQINPAYVKMTFETPVAGITFLERNTQDKLKLQYKIQGIIENAIQDGLTTKQVADKLKEVDDVFSQSFNKAITTARTELLRGYSYGTEESINQSKYVGVDGQEIWDATLDSRTRPSHAAKDQTPPKEDGYWYFSDGSRGKGPRMPGLSAAQSVNCRCRKVYLPFDVTPNVRGGRLPNGDWSTEFGGMDWKEWASKQEKAGTIDQITAQKLKIVKKLT